MTDHERTLEQAAAAFRERRSDGVLVPSPAWHDLDEGGRMEAFELAVLHRRLEAAAHPGGLSSTAQAVLARIRS